MLNDSEDNLRRDFDQVFGPFGQCPPYNGADWRDVGIHCDLLIAFAELRGIELYIFFGNRKLHHIEGTSEKYLTCFCWDNHCYFAKSSQYYHSVRCLGLDKRLSNEKVEVERDMIVREVDWKPWCGEVEAGLF